MRVGNLTPDLRSLEVFFWVATLNNFGQAATRLHMTQPAVSQRIAALEAELGGRLLDRSSRTVQLTPKGRQLLAYAERFLFLHTEMIRNLASPDRLGGLIRLGVSETIVQTWLSDFIEQVSHAYPAVTFDIEVDVTTRLKADLLRDELDLALLMGPVNEPGFTDLHLDAFPLAFVGHAGLRFEHEPISTADLQKHALITYQKSTTNYRELQQLMRQATAVVPRIHASSSLATIIRMTRDGIGIAVIPPAVIEPELKRQELRILPTMLKVTPLHFTVSYRLGPDVLLPPLIAQIAVKASNHYASQHKMT